MQLFLIIHKSGKSQLLKPYIYKHLNIYLLFFLCIRLCSDNIWTV